MPYDVPAFSMVPVVEGMRDLLKVNLIALTTLTQDAHAGDTVLHVDNARRFNRFDYVLLMDSDSKQDKTTGKLSNVEFHRVSEDFSDTGLLHIAEPVQRTFSVANKARIQKTIEKVPLYEKDVLFGDRQVIDFFGVAICVEPESQSQEWLAVRLLGHEYRMSIMVYVKAGGTSVDEEFAQRICMSYVDAVNRLLMGNIHLDLAFDSVPLARDAYAGDQGVWISCDAISQWQAGIECMDYEVQDNFGADQIIKIVDEATSSSSSTESSLTIDMSSSRSSSSGSSISSRTEESSASSLSSWSSQSTLIETPSTSMSSTSSSRSSASSASSPAGQACFVTLNKPLTRNYRVADKANLRRRSIYTYDSRVESVEYGTTQKGSVLIKGAKISWFGKEAEAFQFPQPGIGRAPR